jgi:polysaccharide pyruvyl transferase WcaK-like protein
MFAVFASAILMRLFGDKSKSKRNGNPVLNALEMSKLVIVCGGDMLADSYGTRAMMLHIYNIALALILKKKIIILGTSIGPIRSKLLRKIAFYFLKKLELIIVRDKKSLSELCDEGMDERRLCLIPDTAFDLPVEPDLNYDRFFDDQQVHYIGIGTSILASKYIDKEKLASMVASLCDHLVCDHKSKVIFVAHVLTSAGDIEYSKNILAKMKNKDDAVIIHDFNPMKIKYVISKLDLLISFRMHPIVHALSSGVPVIGIDYNVKTRELLKLFDAEKWVVDIGNLDMLSSLVDEFFLMKERDKDFYRIKRITVSEDYLKALTSV